ncbi:MAG: M1 family metallopeptidase, partial [Myxococcales bacterium]|nr:M1 family metallopeptidase [Myxococcales bacterium]
VEAFLNVKRGEPLPFALPGERAKHPKDRPVVPRHVHLDVALDLVRHTLEGNATLVLTCLAESANGVELDARDLEIESVYIEGNPTPATFAYDGMTLTVPFSPMVRNDTRTIMVRYAARGPRLGLYFIEPTEALPDRPRHAWTQNQDDDAPYWFPCIDDPGVKMTTSVAITADASLRALSNGVLQEPPRASHLPGRTITTWHMDSPVPAYLVTLVVGPFEEHVDPTDAQSGAEVVWYHLPGRAADAGRAFGQTRDMIRFFEDYIGVPYAWPRYGQVAVSEFVFGGMENTTLTTVTDNVLYDERAALDYTADSLVAHELAHQWFGDLVTCREWAHAWLNEGFATYFDCLYQRHHLGQEEFDYELLDLARGYYDEDRSRYRRPIVARDYSEPVDLFDKHLYHKGAWILHMLRVRLGESSFRSAVKVWLERFRFSQAETHDFRRAIEDATGVRLSGFFEQWVERTGYPQLSWTLLTGKGPAVIRIDVKGGVHCPIATEVLVGVAGATRRFPVTLDQGPISVVLGDVVTPEFVVLDPDYTVLGELTPDLSLQLLDRAIAATTSVSVARRIELLKAVTGRGGPKAADLLARTLRGDPFWAVRKEAAKQLAELRTKATRDLLIAALPTEAHPKARRGIVAALGEFRGDAVAAAALEPIARDGDPSYFVEADAVTAYAKTALDAAFPILDTALDRPSFNDVIAAGAIAGLAHLRSARAVDPIRLRCRAAYSTLVRSAALSALGRLGRDLPQVRQVVLDELETHASDENYRIQLAVLAALEALGGTESLGLVERVDRAGADGRVHRRAAEARRAVERKLDAAFGPGAGIRDDMNKLRTDLLTIRDRVDRLPVPPGT